MHHVTEMIGAGTRRVDEPLVYLVEDDPDVRRSIGRLLDTVGLEIRAFGRAQDAIEAIDSVRPGCLIIDMRLPDRDGLDLLEDLRDADVSMPAIVITAYADVPSAIRAMKLKVFDFIEKPFPDQQFLAAVQKAVDHDQKHFAMQNQRRLLIEKIDELSEREREVLHGVVSGNSSKMIASELGISQKTVENYRASLMSKLEADNVAHLVTMVYEYYRRP